MRLLTHRSAGLDRAAVQTEGGVLDAAGLLGLESITVRELLESGRLAELAGAAEAGIEPPGAPTMFAKFRNALAPDGASVPLPESSEKVDFEAEVAFVIGRRCKEVEPDRDPSGVGSVRDPRIRLKPRDEVVISSPTLGRLETTLA